MSHDQAETLRAWVGAAPPLTPAPVPRPRAADGASGPLVLTVASGKGGVGKTSLVANLAVALARHSGRVLAIDGDLGLANLDLMFGVTPRYSLLDVLQNDLRPQDAVVPGPAGVGLLPACSGRFDMANLDLAGRQRLNDALGAVAADYDVVLVDTAAGLGTNVMGLAGAAAHVLVVVTPEPTAMADAYGLIKVLQRQCGIERVQLVANRVAHVAEGEALFARLAQLVDRFLGASVEYLGAVVQDPEVSAAIRARVPLLLRTPGALAVPGIEGLAQRLRALAPRPAAPQARA